MKRIVIVGCSGAGKTRLAVSLAEALGLQAYHLDRIYLERRMQQARRGDFWSEHERLLHQPSWILDGNFARMMSLRFERADTIIFLDLPVYSCLWGFMCRKLSSRGQFDPQKQGNLNRLSWSHLRYILVKHRRRHRPAILRKLEVVRGKKRVFVLRSRAEVAAFQRKIAMSQLSARLPIADSDGQTAEGLKILS